MIADVLLQPREGDPALDPKTRVTPKNVERFLAADEVVEGAAEQLRELGFEVTFAGPSHITVTGPQELHERTFGITLVERTAPAAPGSPRRRQKRTFLVARGEPTVPPDLARFVVAVEYPGPIDYVQSPTPPALAYDHMQVPDDVARAMDAVKVHQHGITGNGIRLAMVDSGFLTPQHPYFNGRGYNLQPVNPDPADPAPNADEVGHGTGIATCALAVAPGAEFTMYKIFTANGSAAFAAGFGRAAAANPHIITCSWTVPFSAALRLAINNAVAGGIVVCFATGNGGPAGWPGTEPAVISVGGTFIDADDAIQASTFASSGTNASNPGRQVPDLTGIVGQAPSGILIAMPTQPGAQFDAAFSGGTFPNGDTTTANDGWLVASGTSSASPMVAGTAALIMQAEPATVGSPVAIRQRLIDSCIDVVTGNSAAGQAAGGGQDLATGAGLVQAYRAVRTVDVWLRDNSTSDRGLVPTHARRPSWPPHAHWVSPDIKVFPAPLANPAAEFDSNPAESPVFGQDNFVYVRARNRGRAAAADVTVGLFYADPATAMAFPADWRDGQSGVAAQGSIQVAGAGTNQQLIASIPAGGMVIAPEPFVWRPPDPTTATQSQTLPDGRTIGHFCLLVRLDSTDDPILLPGGGQSSVIGDNNIAMANQSVFSAPPGHAFTFRFLVRHVREEKKRRADLDLRLDLRGLPRRSQVVLRFDGDPGKRARAVGGRRRGSTFRFDATREPVGVDRIGLAAGKEMLAEVEVRLPDRVKPRDYRIGVLQRMGREPVGGVTLVARVERRHG
ncbi:MAG TPA: S8 family serine peptidase [Solirubrobacteraceae bacterium]|nr:S8 family serine peptidase [Solirubrobacteraceae bacterium]